MNGRPGKLRLYAWLLTAKAVLLCSGARYGEPQGWSWRLIVDNSAVDLFLVSAGTRSCTGEWPKVGQPTFDHEPFYSQTDRISSEIPETQSLVPQGIGLTIQIN
jgi:hypothetical protein